MLTHFCGPPVYREEQLERPCSILDEFLSEAWKEFFSDCESSP